MRILAAEDTPSLRALLQLCLERAGHQVELAENGRDALDLFVAGSFDVVILDIQMPVMDGLEAAGRMRVFERENGRVPTPLLALTANTEGADLRRCLEAGCTSTVRKPFGREDLLSAVAKYGRQGTNATPAVADAAAPSAPSTPAPDSAEPIKRIAVEADPDFADLIAPFLVNCRDEAEAMRRALGRGDFDAIAAASHKIIGAGASYGFQPLSDECRAIESAARAGDAATAVRHLDALDSYLARVKVVFHD